MRLPIKILVTIIGFAILTILTQVGGIVFLLVIGIQVFVKTRVQSTGARYFAFAGVYIVLYSIVSILVVPPLAQKFGRVPLPMYGEVRPLNIVTCILNRHYVRPMLREAVLQSAETFRKQYPGAVVNYLDGCLPFYNGFPLMPHLSHNDGRKLDIAFFYMNVAGKPQSDAPSWIGYGVCERPRAGEENYPLRCRNKGYWQYGILEQIVPQGKKSQFIFDAQRTAFLVNILSKQSSVQKIFIEPHLKMRLQLTSPKVRYHGCQAVRHDDHVHVQIY
ncbi:hypothetical protein [Ohtaekwangia sp.]|uniref:hypothetical protein n=1 Tax=Ohtaekwangia sp. TaxID=2066019 RepID=UPI002FDCD0D0